MGFRFVATPSGSIHRLQATTRSLRPVFWTIVGTAGLCATIFLSPPILAEEDLPRAEKHNAPSTLISFQEVQKHNKQDDCWVVIRDQVYDLTNFINIHPGGKQIIIRNAGKDATKIFEPIHPKGVIEAMLKPEQKLGRVDPSTMPAVETLLTDDEIRVLKAKKEKPPLSAMINLADIEDVARKVMTGQAWHYYRSDAEDGYIGTTDMTTTILGIKSSLPIFVSPAAMAGLGHPEGEKNITRGAGKEGIIQNASGLARDCSKLLLKSEYSSHRFRQMHPVLLKRSQKPGQMANHSSFKWVQLNSRSVSLADIPNQLYVANDRQASEAKLKKVEELGFNAVMLTVDAPTLGRREYDMREKTVTEEGDDAQSGGVSTSIDGYFDGNIGWKDVEWLQRSTKLPIIIKGIQSVEDCKLAVQYPGVKGILLSNHGGRQADYAPASIDVLYELRTTYPEVFDKVEIYVDGGFRRGTDVLKALCLGATAVGFGRSFLYANAAYGEAGVGKTIKLLRGEIANAMQQIGLRSLAECKPDMVKYMERSIDPPKSSDYSQV
ncbi:Cytochrome b2, mitochondrial precursor [Tulasnella sp. 331]|nr:Cytochrome b2, mitochondrial precursor [Tulasnella sp. 331]